jgi:hypothetical protein
MRAKRGLLEDGGAELGEWDETPSRIVFADATSGARERGPSFHTRKGTRRLIGGIGRADQPGWEPGPVGTWVAAHKVALRVAGVALAILVLLVWSSPRPLTILVLALLLLVYLVVIEFLGRAPSDVETPADSRNP